MEKGFTDTVEEQKKKKQQERQTLENKLLKLKSDRSTKINQKIKELTAKNEAVTLQAISMIKQNPISEALIIQKDKNLVVNLN